MKYVIANLYGDWERYTSVLKGINFKKEDILFVLGDIVDGGNKGIEILKDMMLRENVYPVLGDHDYIAYEVLSGIWDETMEDITAPLSNDLAERCREWSERGGEGTLDGFAKLSDEDKEAVIEYLEEFALFEEIETEDIDYVLCHSAPESFMTDDDLGNYSARDILSGNVDYERDYFFGRVLVSAGEEDFKNECHVVIGEGVYCLDTGEFI
ncbi:MAG: metallophosphoesterase [Clostridia bacterium]|nr:metallophosphoesterase [Clostridia bacterium]